MKFELTSKKLCSETVAELAASVSDEEEVGKRKPEGADDQAQQEHPAQDLTQMSHGF